MGYRRQKGSWFDLRAARVVLVLLTGLWLPRASGAKVPGPEELLPDDTLLVVTAPDFVHLREVWRQSPQRQLWNDPAMKPFKDDFSAKWNEQLVQPLERELGVKFEDYLPLVQGQVTFAVTQNGWRGEPDQPLGLLLLLDVKDQRERLTRALGELRQKSLAAGKSLRTERIRDLDFNVLSVSSNDVPKTLRKFFPPAAQVQELGAETPARKTARPSELVFGQADSLLIVANSAQAVEKVLIRLGGGAVPALGELAAYRANHLAWFRDAPFYAWANAKVYFELWSQAAAQKKDNPEAPNPFDIPPDKLIKGLGFSGLKTVAFSFQDSNEGALFTLFVGVPEATRQGLFKIFAAEPKESSPPPFVPADAVKFRRWRLDGKKTWATLEKMLTETSPQSWSGLSFILDSAAARARQLDPTFDLKRSLLDSLGDDVVTYEKAPRDSTPAVLDSPPSLLLFGATEPKLLAAALKGLFVIFPQGDTIAEREFLGRKVYSVALPTLALGSAAETSRAGAPSTLYFAASGSYVALSTDVALLEEYLRSSESQGQSLRELPGLAQAAECVVGPGTGLFGYENQLETMRAYFASVRKNPALVSNPAPSTAAALLPGAFGVANPEQKFKSLMDLSLLPPFEAVSKYFSFAVYADSANVDGLTFRYFLPTPPAAKR